MLPELRVQAQQAFLPVKVFKREPKLEIELIRTGVHLEIQRARKRGLVSLMISTVLNQARKKKTFLGTNNRGVSSVYITKQHASARFPCPPTQASARGFYSLRPSIH